jgi:predicted deacylase
MKRISILALAIALPAAVSAQGLSVAGTTAAPGTTAYGRIDIAAGVDEATFIPFALIQGAKPGRTVAILSGAHGTEYASIIAAQHMIQRIEGAKLTGAVIVVPLINRASFERMRVHMNPVDEKSMNGNYPGKATGTQTERALDRVARDVIQQADVVIDLHNGDIDENLRPYSYWMRSGDVAKDSLGLELALAMGLDHIIIRDVDLTSPANTRSASGYSASLGKLVLVAEAGRWARTDASDVRLLEDGLLGVLGQLGMLQRAKAAPLHITWLGEDARVRADSNVMWVASVDRDTRVKSGQVVGYTTDYWGRKIADVKAPKSGLVSFIRSVPSAWAGSTLVTITDVVDKPGPWKKAP